MGRPTQVRLIPFHVETNYYLSCSRALLLEFQPKIAHFTHRTLALHGYWRRATVQDPAIGYVSHLLSTSFITDNLQPRLLPPHCNERHEASANVRPMGVVNLDQTTTRFVKPATDDDAAATTNAASRASEQCTEVARDP